MEAQQQENPILTQIPRPLTLKDPLVIGAGSLVLGFVIGSGRWQWLGQRLGRVAGGLGDLALIHLVQTLKSRHPELFSRF